jgi:branched-chain amino acid transport system permease protein
VTRTTVQLKPISRAWQEPLIRFAPYIVGGIILVILPLFLPSPIQGIFTRFLIFAIFATSYDLVYGHLGLPSLGHAIFFGAGGYVAAVLQLHYDIYSFWIAAPLGALVAVLGAAIFGVIVLRLKGLYFLLISMALGQVAFSIAWEVAWLNIPGMQGITGIARPELGIPGFTWSAISFYYFVLIIFSICLFLIYRIMNSPFGHALRGIREGEPRMQTLGYNTWLYKYIAIIITGAFAGVAGVLFAYSTTLMIPAHLGLETSFLPMVMVIIGGSTTLFGPVIGGTVIIFVEYFVRLLTPERWPLILGIVFVAAVMFARGGINIHLSRLWKKVSCRYGSIKS